MIVPACRSARLTTGYIVRILMHRDASDVCGAALSATGMPLALPAVSHPSLREFLTDQQSVRT